MVKKIAVAGSAIVTLCNAPSGARRHVDERRVDHFFAKQHSTEWVLCLGTGHDLYSQPHHETRLQWWPSMCARVRDPSRYDQAPSVYL